MITKLTTTTLRQGQKDPLVARLHRILEVLGYKANIPDPFVFSGITTKLLYQFQQEQNIQATGIVDKPTAALLEKHYSSTEFGKSHKIIVVVIEKSTGKPLEKIRVQVLDKNDNGKDNLLEEKVTDGKGYCSFEFDEMSYRNPGDPQKVLPNIYFKMFDGTRRVFDTEDDVKRNLPRGDHRFSFEVQLRSEEVWQITGIISDSDGNPEQGIRIEALDKKSSRDEALADSTSRGNGQYELKFDRTKLKSESPNYLPDVFLRAYKDNKLITDTGNKPFANLAPGTLEYDLVLETKSRQGQFKVSGLVFSAKGEVVPDAEVRVYDVDLRGAAIYDQVNSRQELEEVEGMELLGETATNAEGYYEVLYEASAFSQNERGLADVVAYALREDEIAGRSRLAFKKEYNGSNEIKDLDVQLENEEDEISEFDLIYPTARDFAAEANLTLTAISSSPAQIVFVAEEIDFPASQVQILTTADRLVEEASNFPLLLDFMYALGRKDVPLTWYGIAGVPRSRLRQILLQAIDENIIASYDEKAIDSFLNVLEELAVSFSLDQAPQETPSIRDFLNLALPDENNAHAELMTAYTNHEGPVSDFWNKVLPSLPAFQNNSQAIHKLQLTNSLSILTRHNLSFIQELQKLNIRDPREIIYHPEEFDEIIQQHKVPGIIPGENEDIKKENYKRIMLRDLQATYPTDTVAFGIEQGDLQIKEDLQEDIAGFFRAAIPEGFDLRKSDVADFENLFQDISPDRVADLQMEVNKLKRILQVSPSPKAMSGLLNNNFSSVNEIAAIPKEIFKKKYRETLGEEETEIIHQRAVSINAYNEYTLLNLHQFVHEPTFAMVGGSMNPFKSTKEAFLIEEAINGAIPEWRQLVGNLDFCECKHCRSMLSPAAYLIDLMHHYLNKGAEANEMDGVKPLEVLLSRRPDIAHLELTCENTNTIIPYVDLVNEILEYYVQHDSLTGITAEEVRNTEKVTPAELQASPQFHQIEAYRILSQSIFPFKLPYHQPLDAIRIYLDHLKSSRYEVIDVLHPDKPAEVTEALVMEYLGLDPLSYKIIIGEEITLPDAPNPVSLPEFYGYEREDAEDDAEGDTYWKSLSTTAEDSILNIPELLDRTGVKYEDLIALLKTRFLNPHADQLLHVDQLFSNSGITGDKLYEKLDQIMAGTLNPAEDAAIMETLEEAEFEPDTFREWVGENFPDIRQVITLYEADAECNLENTQLRTIGQIYDSESEEVPDDFFNLLHRFIRLWRKTGWSIQDLDITLKSLNTADLNAGVLEQIYYISKIQKALRIPLAPLMSLWGTLDTQGSHSLYHKLFLNKAIQKIDDAFRPDKFGRYFHHPESDPPLLNAHLPAILAAFRLKASELQSIMATAFLGDASELNLQNLSIIYRQVILARALKLKVQDLSVLLNIIGEDAATADLFYPFAQWNDENRFISQDPHKTWAFIELLDKIHDSGFKLQTLNYLIHNEEPEDERLSPAPELFHRMLLSLRDDFQAIEQDHPSLENVNEDILRQKLGMFFEQAYVDQIVGLINKSSVFVSHAPAGLSLTIPDTLSDKLEYDSDTGTIRFSGIMSEDEKAVLDRLNTNNQYLSAIQDLFDQPQATLHDILFGIFQGSMDEAESVLLSRPPSSAEALPTTEEKFTFIYGHLLPFLKEKLRQDSFLTHLAEILNLDEVRVQHLLRDEVDPWKEFLAGFGLSGTYGFPSGEELQRDEYIDFEWDASGPEEVTWNGWIRIPSNEPFTFIVEVKQDEEQATLSVNHELLIDNRAPGDPLLSANQSNSHLDTGTLYPVQVTYRRNGAAEGGVRLSWKAPAHPKEVIPGVHLFPVMDSFHSEVLNWNRGSLLINGFGLNSEEIVYFKNNNTDFNDLDYFNLNLPAWLRLYNYNYLKKRLLKNSPALINLFSGAIRGDHSISDTGSHLSESFKGNSDQFSQIITEFGYDVSDFFNEQALMSVYRCWQVINKLGIPVDVALQWGAIDEDFDSLHELAQDIKRTVKAKYEEEVWLEVAPKLSDLLREHQKNALIQYLLVQPALINWGVKDADGLFNYFLIDVQMDACMDTSRIKQALSSVQLFVHRCFLNLENRVKDEGREAGVKPEYLSRPQWEWMKNYRVWEANRKVLIHAENWVLPEFRIDKSAAYKGAESFLKQNDITPENAEIAFRNYLHSLAEVAKLDICGLCEDEAKGEIHVFGRMTTKPNKIFYRKFQKKYKKWSPWEPVEVNVQGVEDREHGGEYSGVHLLPVVWKGRLLLFWPIFTEKITQKNSSKRLEEIDNEISEKTERLNEYRQLVRDGANRAYYSPLIFTLILEILALHGEKKKLEREENSRISTLAEQPVSNLEPEKHWEVKLSFSEFRQQKWEPGNEIDTHIFTTIDTPPNEITFDVVASHEGLSIWMYEGIYDDNSKVKSFDLTSIFSPAKTSDIGYYPKDEGYANLYNKKTKRSNELLQLKMAHHSQPSTYLQDGTSYSILFPNAFEYTWPYNLEKITSFFYQDDQKVYFASPKPLYLIHHNIDITYNNNFSFAQPNLFNSSVFTEHTGVGNEINTGNTNSGSNLSLNLNARENSWRERLSIEEQNYLTESIHPSIFRFDNLAKNTDFKILSFDLKFETFFHPYVDELIERLNRGDINEMHKWHLTRDSDNGSIFRGNYDPTNLVITFPEEKIDFSPEGAYSLYNWELFYHLPLYIGSELSKNNQFEKAASWLQLIFDPTTNERPTSEDYPEERYWKVKPFKQNLQTIRDYLNNLGENDPLIDEWRDHPFQPHIIARHLPNKYKKVAVMKTIDNYLAWGDQLFRQDTIESINEATQLYILASHILGARPKEIPPRGLIRPQTYDNLKESLNDLSNAKVLLENRFPHSGEIPVIEGEIPSSLLGAGSVSYFCIPSNVKLLEYWDVVEDRLFKIRHCMNIEGVERQLALFQPSIDPGLLVRATAGGMSLGSVLSDLNSPLSQYRFQFIFNKALEFCGEVKSIGASLLSALEKKDAEEITQIRSAHELTMLNAIRQVRVEQKKEAEQAEKSILKSRDVLVANLVHYQELLGIEEPIEPEVGEELTELEIDVDVSLVDTGTTGVKLIPRELEELDKANQANNFRLAASVFENLASMANTIPNFSVNGQPFGIGGSTSFGGSNLGAAISSLGRRFEILASQLNFESSQASRIATHIRREQEWTHQANQLIREIKRIDSDLLGAQIRKDIANKELENHDQQIAHAEEMELFLRDKFTNKELYSWMEGQLVRVYKQFYQLAYEMAKKAEKLYRFELGEKDTNFIRFGYFDSNKKGLLAGEQLNLSLRQMERSYLEKNKRELEITKHISLQQLNPMALLELKATGTSEINIPEWVFDLDCPGHYLRRIKTISVSIPAVAGPYTSVNCTLTLQKSTIRTSSIGENYTRDLENDDPRFTDNFGTIQSMVTSSAQNDSGMFETNLRDERFLPFEGAGAISTWRLELPSEIRQFDYSTITDIIIHVRYTAREGGKALAKKASSYIKTILASAVQGGLTRLFSLRHDLPDSWHRFISLEEVNFKAKISRDHFPYIAQAGDIGPSDVRFELWKIDEENGPLVPVPLSDGDISFNLDQLNAGEREGEIELIGVLDKTSDFFLLINYKIDFR